MFSSVCLFTARRQFIIRLTQLNEVDNLCPAFTEAVPCDFNREEIYVGAKGNLNRTLLVIVIWTSKQCHLQPWESGNQPCFIWSWRQRYLLEKAKVPFEVLWPAVLLVNNKNFKVRATGRAEILHLHNICWNTSPQGHSFISYWMEDVWTRVTGNSKPTET